MYLFASRHHEVMILRGTCPGQSSFFKTVTQEMDSQWSRSSVDFETESTIRVFCSKTIIANEDNINPYESTS